MPQYWHSHGCVGGEAKLWIATFSTRWTTLKARLPYEILTRRQVARARKLSA